MVTESAGFEDGFWWKRPEETDKPACAMQPKPGDLCPECAEGRLDYDDLFMLSCPNCHHVAESGIFS